MSPPEGHLLGCQSGNFCWPISGGTMTVSPNIAYDNDPCLPGCGDRVRVKSASGATDELFAAKSTPTVLLSVRIKVTRPH